MIVGVVKEIRTAESRVALVPAGVEVLCAHGHRVLVARGAGIGAGYDDESYVQAGAQITDAASVWGEAELLLKVKEPQPSEFPFLRSGLALFTYFHFAADEDLTRAVLDSGCAAIAYETVEDAAGRLPLLTPMSEVAGRMAIQEAAKYLERPQGGRGVLLGGVPGVTPASVVVLGGGVVGTEAARMAAGLGARVTIIDISLPRLRYLADVMPANVTTLASYPENIRSAVKSADVVVGAVLVRGAKAPHLVDREFLRQMQLGAVAVDPAIDQGGCFETSRPTTHDAPIYEEEGVVHYCVTNMPGAVPVTSTAALTNATLPYALRMADMGWRAAIAADAGLAKGLNIADNALFCPGVAETFALPLSPVASLFQSH
ncbi:alanine dehydrogenase [Magnetofaba australis]|uniref:Alanine dehydrogenase n=1 Tax=Magnetofaba australis IT-1 TaxID=1434232 RepID=A0A1Y2K0W8_9PROT|nr:alanine dehydrogenase [Magnetofaba australis]OSM00454.1 putative L-alanine dehydrogenase [Magnetofaba australis IT-1]